MYGSLFTQAELDAQVSEGFVRVNKHPEAELYILNYTEKAAFDRRWNNVTLNCRGLIVDAFGDIVARPFPKFFNYGESDAPEVKLTDRVIVSDKMDGSLGILYKMPGSHNDFRIATRGSFTSDQAIHATRLLKQQYAYVMPLNGLTYLFEIIYPQNRIVCDYEGLDDLVLLGAQDIDDSRRFIQGAWGRNSLHWYGPVAKIFEYKTFQEVIEAEPRKGKEGFVVHLPNHHTMVKVKQEDYIRLHRIVTGLNARSVWQAMVDDKVDELIEQVPDEFHDFVKTVRKHIQDQVDELVDFCLRKFARIEATLPEDASKRDFAMLVKDDNYAWAMFNLWDGKPIRPKFLELCKPAHDFNPVRNNG